MKKFMFALVAFVTPMMAFAEEAAASGSWQKSAAYFLAVALAALGGTTGQSKAASAALQGIARNPSAADKIQTPMILGLALMESLVIVTFITIFVA